MNKKIIFIRLAAVCAVLGMLLPLLICSPAAEKAGASPSDGVFRIRSASTGQYLTAYLNGSRGYGKAYIAPLDSTNEAQIFLLRRTDDGSFTILAAKRLGSLLLCIFGKHGCGLARGQIADRK